MKTSQSIGHISSAIAAAQAEMESAKFDSKNPHFNSRYASLASVIEAVKPLALNGVALTQDATVSRDDKGSIITVTTMLSHGESGEWISSELSMRIERDTPQGIGSALTYARRYSISAICGIAADEDDDAEKVEPRKPEPPKPPKKEAPKPPAKTEKPAEPTKQEAPKPPAEKPAEPPKQEAKKVDIPTLRRINGLLGANNLSTPEEKKDVVECILGRSIVTAAELTEAEASAVIDKLNEMLANQKEAA